MKRFRFELSVNGEPFHADSDDPTAAAIMGLLLALRAQVPGGSCAADMLCRDESDEVACVEFGVIFAALVAQTGDVPSTRRGRH